ncbi:hypothetical protein HMPREF9057_01465 [Actinomyces sp. oral taxon 171 str. F0337]|nr:hypothetical protein HMPREF9057_01465 [Actinomyces sp. oral taxon 171 str. F0337]
MTTRRCQPSTPTARTRWQYKEVRPHKSDVNQKYSLMHLVKGEQ